jgi:membrane fusion protein (multidrug efflux system)
VGARLNSPADPAATLVEVVDPNGLQVHFSVPPDQAAALHPGVPLQVSAGRAAGGTLLGTGHVTAVGAVIDSASGSVDVRGSLDTRNGNLFVGEDVFGSITVAQDRSAVSVPPDALVPAGNGFQVFVVDAKGIAHARPVTVGARTETAVEIRSGLQGGETVVTTGAYGVQDKARIRRAAP